MKGVALEFVDLHNQVDTSVSLLGSLDSFFTTFQRDLSAVSGQIADLQARSKDIDARLQSRKKIEKPLSNLLAEICIPPSLVTLILDSSVNESWLDGIAHLEKCMLAIQPRAKLPAAKDVSAMAEGLRIVAATKLRAFFLAILAPIRASMSTNLPVLQSAMLLKYRPLLKFLQRHAVNVADEIKMTYVAVARTYYETGFRRYTRSLGNAKTKTVEKHELITATQKAGKADVDVTQFATVTGAGVILAYVADGKLSTEPMVSTFRSMMMVLMDNASVEYTFLLSMFSAEELAPGVDPLTEAPMSAGASVVINLDASEGKLSRRSSYIQPSAPSNTLDNATIVEPLWKQIFEPALGHCNKLVTDILESSPSVITLLTMVKLNDAVVVEAQLRQCYALEAFATGVRLSIWPIFQKHMNDHISAIKRLADTTTGGLLSRTHVKDSMLQDLANRYVELFTTMVSLDDEEEAIIFSNLSRLRQEFLRLIINQSEKLGGQKQSAVHRITIFETILESLSRCGKVNTHPKAQAELAFWRTKEEESRRRMTNEQRSR